MMLCHSVLSLVAAMLISQTAGEDRSFPDFVLWKADVLERSIARLDREIGDKALVYETIGNYERHSVYLVLRGKTSPAELHETEADLYVVRRGRATLLLGGELVDAENRPRKQQRGSSIRGGIKREIGPGDVIHIPVGVPHQLVLPDGESFLYDLTKFNEEPLASP